jgi:arabinofuranan 3-O-arabinosyltransferase
MFAISWIAVAGAVYVFDLLRQTRAGLTNGAGRPFGDDFINYWSAASLAWHGRAGEIYDWSAFHAFEERVAGAGLDFYHYSYPPVLAVLTAPLAALGYVPALFLWLLAGWLCFFLALGTVRRDRGVLLLALATPAVFISFVGGQNGTWTAAFLGGGLALLERRPVVAGVLLGLLIQKPQLGLLLPVALLAGGHVRAFAVAAAKTIARIR